MASSLTRSTLSFRRQGSSGISWHEGWIHGESDGSGRSALAINTNVQVAVDAVLSENTLKLPESSTTQVLLHSRSLRSNPTPAAGSAYSHEADHCARRREITSGGAPKKTKSRFTRWLKRAFSKSSSA